VYIVASPLLSGANISKICKNICPIEVEKQTLIPNKFKSISLGSHPRPSMFFVGLFMEQIWLWLKSFEIGAVEMLINSLVEPRSTNQ
jgi:hypothetical protein